MSERETDKPAKAHGRAESEEKMKNTKNTQNAATSKKHDGQMTKVNGFILEIATMTSEPFEIEVEYCRASAIAANRVANAMNLDTKKFMVVIPEGGIQNESAKRWRYDYPSLVQAATRIVEDTEEFTDEEHEAGYVLVEVPQYVYSAQLWIYCEDTDEYITERCEYTSFEKFTRGDARSFVWHEREEESKLETVIGYHGAKREENTVFAVVTSEDANSCKKYTEDTEV